MREEKNILVAVWMVTYNQENYIAQSIEGIVKQHTTFKFKLFIGEDCSTDNTQKICSDYSKRFADKIELISTQVNNIKQNSKNIYDACFNSGAKYIAMCEGDDYWCDENKLQKQVDFLEANPDYAICFHAVNTLENGTIRPSELNFYNREETYSILDLADRNMINTASVVFRNGLIQKFPDWFSESPAGDYILHFLNAKKGFIKYFPEVMSVYRRHSNGVWSGLKLQDMLRKYIYMLDLLISENFDEAVSERLLLQKRKHVEEYLNVLIKEDDPTKFLKELETFSKADSYIAKKWLLEYYPAQINSLKSYMNEIASARSFKLSKKISKVYRHFKNFLS